MTGPNRPPNWPFDAPPNVAVFTLKSIVDEGKPILLVSHDEDDGGWQFLDGSDPKEEDALIVSLYEMVSGDPSLAELADLPEGWQAWRQTAESKWSRAPHP